MSKVYEQYRKEITNRERFVGFAEKRVNRILNALESLGNCSNRRNYDYSNADVKKIFGAIEKKVRETRLMFQGERMEMEGNMNRIDDRSERRKKANRDRFVRIAEGRVNRILDALESLGNCSNRRNYDYSNADVKKIFGAIEKKVKETRLMFQGTSQDRKRFTLG